MQKIDNLNIMDRVLNRQTTWYLINIKARREQTAEHYVQVFRSLYEQDPLVGFPRGGKSGSLKYVTFSNLLDETAILIGYKLDYFHIQLLTQRLSITNASEKM